MLAENISASFLKQISPVQQSPLELGYFRSKLFTTNAFTNPLVAAASPLISLLERIHIAHELPEIEELHANIHHEFKAFHGKIYLHHYPEEFYTIANYLLTATTDEILGKTYMRLSNQNKSFNAFTPISKDSIGPEEHFFNILHHLMSDPKSYLDLIELSYYCLLIGFEGKYHLDSNGRFILDNLIESLYQTIHKYRNNKIQKLFKNYILKTKHSKKTLSTFHLAIITSLCVLSFVFISQLWIKYQSNLLLDKFTYSSEWI